MKSTLHLILALCYTLLFAMCDHHSPHDTVAYNSAKDIATASDLNAVVNQAIEKARNQLNLFRQALLRHVPNTRLFALKLRFTTTNGNEHIWISQVSYQQGHYHCIIDNIPESVIGVHQGDSVIVRPEQITDWMYVEDNRIRGGYTIRALRKMMKSEAIRQLDQEIGLPFWED